MPVTMQILGLEKLDRLFADFSNELKGGVKVIGAAAAYALVWEWGSVRITKPGPKTTWGTNPAGAKVVLTITAPAGYIRINRMEYIKILKQEVQAAHMSKVQPQNWENALKDALSRAEIRCSLLISGTAPIDSGDLRMSIVPAGVNSAILDEGTSNEYGPTQFDLGSDWL
jgi:hypothetical protein